MQEILKDLDDVYFNLVNTGEKSNLGQYYVLARGAILKKMGQEENYSQVIPTFHSNTAEECLGALAKYLKS